MPFTFSTNGSEVEAVAAFRNKLGVLVPALVEKMTVLMTKLQEKAQAKVSSLYPGGTGALRDSISDPRAIADGNTIIGLLNWGGPETTVSFAGGRSFDYAQVLEYGGREEYVINPLTAKGTRQHVKGAKRRFGKEALSFVFQGKLRAFSHVFHPPIAGQFFMTSSVDEMRSEIAFGLRDTIISEVNKRG